MIESLYSIATKCVQPLAPCLVRLLAPGDPREREERLGRYGDPGIEDSIWIHAASAGETEGAEPIVREIGRTVPGRTIVLTSMTAAGKGRAERIAGVRSHYAPLDIDSAVRSAFRAFRPSALLLVETEIWPNLIREASRLAVPAAIVNGRISAKAFRRMLLVRPLYRAALSRVSLLGVQREADRDRFAAFGVPRERIFIHGNTKIDTESPAPPDLGLRRSDRERWVVFGSVRSAERGAVLRAARAVLEADESYRVAVVPRHPARAGDYLGARGVPLRRWSEAGAGAGRAVLVDTVGDLLSFYAMGDVAFVGGSLSGHGGHNPIEPARFGVPVLMGPRRENCRDLAVLLEEAGALEEAADGEALARKTLALLSDDEERRRRGEAGRAAILAGRGAAARSVRRLLDAGILKDLQP
ncbi:MAG: glycosyltransferase N-terminal domain-containing protein [Candidatus Eisenbacteria bacterium]